MSLFNRLLLALAVVSVYGSLVIGPFFGVRGFSATPYKNLAFALIAFTFVFVQARPYLMVGLRIDRWHEFAIILLLWVWAFGLFFGVLYQWPMLHLAGDTTYLTICILAFFVARHFSEIPASYLHTIRFCLWAAILICIGVLVLGVEPDPRLRLILVTFAMIDLFGYGVWHRAPLLVAPMILTVSIMSRSVMGAMFVGALSLIWIYGFKFRMFAICTTVVLVVSAIPELLDIEGTGLHRRLENASAIFAGGRKVTEFVSLYQRIVETQLVLAAMNAEPVSYIWGFGAGAILDMRGSPDFSVGGAAVLGADRVHNVHFLPVALLFRQGLLGVLALVVILVGLGKTILRLRRERSLDDLDPVYVFCAVYPLVAIVNTSMASNYYLTGFMVFACLGYLAARDGAAARSRRSGLEADRAIAHPNQPLSKIDAAQLDKSTV